MRRLRVARRWSPSACMTRSRIHVVPGVPGRTR